MTLASVPPNPSQDQPSMAPEVAEIVALFLDGGRLEEVSFPSVGREPFETLMGHLKARQDQVEELRALLAQARQALIVAESDLLQRAETALAYARVFSNDDDELRAHLDQLLMARRHAKTARPKKRRRKKTAERGASTADSAGELPLVAVG